MAKCPKCGKDINEVEKDTSYNQARVLEILKLENGNVTSRITDTELEYIIFEFYYCPLCKAEISNEDFNVYAFLEGR